MSRRHFAKGAMGAKQRGAALFVSLIMLLVMTILGLSSVQTTSLEERMSRNARDYNLAFQAAESAALDAIEQVDGLGADGGFPSPANGFYVVAAAGAPQPWEAVDWSGVANLIVAPSAIAGVFSPPKYIIERLTENGPSDGSEMVVTNYGEDTGGASAVIYRITTHGTGGTQAARVMIQVTYGRQF